MEYILRETRLKEDGFNIRRKNINNLSCADNTTRIAENAKGLQALVMKVKEHNEKFIVRLNI